MTDCTLCFPNYQVRKSMNGTMSVIMDQIRTAGLKGAKVKQKEWSTYIVFYVLGLGKTDIGIFDGLELGGGRNRGHGRTRLHHHVRTNTDDWIDIGMKYDGVKFTTPLCMESDVPGTFEFVFPSFLEPRASGKYRMRIEKLSYHKKLKDLRLLDHGQVFRVKDGSTVDLVRLGIRRIGNHEKYGYGEFEAIRFGSRG